MQLIKDDEIITDLIYGFFMIQSANYCVILENFMIMEISSDRDFKNVAKLIRKSIFISFLK